MLFIMERLGNFHQFEYLQTIEGMENIIRMWIKYMFCYFNLYICIYIYINCSLSLPVKDSSAEYSNENFSCALYCSRGPYFPVQITSLLIFWWCWKKWINDSSKYFLRFPVIVLKLSFVISVLGLSFVIAFSFWVVIWIN